MASGKSKAGIAKAIVAFAKVNSFLINPRIGYDYFVMNLIILGTCACAPERKSCPCPEAKKEIEEEGKCKCGLYWRDLDCWQAYDPLDPSKPITQGAKLGDQN